METSKCPFQNKLAECSNLKQHVALQARNKVAILYSQAKQGLELNRDNCYAVLEVVMQQQHFAEETVEKTHKSWTFYE